MNQLESQQKIEKGLQLAEDAQRGRRHSTHEKSIISSQSKIHLSQSSDTEKGVEIAIKKVIVVDSSKKQIRQQKELFCGRVKCPTANMSLNNLSLKPTSRQKSLNVSKGEVSRIEIAQSSQVIITQKPIKSNSDSFIKHIHPVYSMKKYDIMLNNSCNQINQSIGKTKIHHSDNLPNSPLVLNDKKHRYNIFQNVINKVAPRVTKKMRVQETSQNGKTDQSSQQFIKIIRKNTKSEQPSLESQDDMTHEDKSCSSKQIRHLQIPLKQSSQTLLGLDELKQQGVVSSPKCSPLIPTQIHHKPNHSGRGENQQLVSNLRECINRFSEEYYKILANKPKKVPRQQLPISLNIQCTSHQRQKYKYHRIGINILRRFFLKKHGFTLISNLKYLSYLQIIRGLTVRTK